MHRWRGSAATAADCNSATEKHRRFESSRHHYPFGCEQTDQQVAAPSRPCCGFACTQYLNNRRFNSRQVSLIGLTRTVKAGMIRIMRRRVSGRLRSSVQRRAAPTLGAGQRSEAARNHVLTFCRIFGLWRSLVARVLWEHGVAGSNPVNPTRMGISLPMYPT